MGSKIKKFGLYSPALAECRRKENFFDTGKVEASIYSTPGDGEVKVLFIGDAKSEEDFKQGLYSEIFKKYPKTLVYQVKD